MIVTWLACLPDPRGGTAVGNPGDADAQARWADPALQLDAVSVPVASAGVARCSGRERVRRAGVVLDGLGPSRSAVVVPGGRACSVWLSLGGPVTAAGTTAAGTVFEVELPVELLAVDGELRIDGESLLFEWPIPFSAAEIDALGPVAQVRADDPEAVGWAHAAERGVSLFVDRDGDGVVSPVDPTWLGGSGAPAYAAQSEGCGCGGSAGAGSWLPALLVLTSTRRPGRSRRSTTRPPG